MAGRVERLEEMKNAYNILVLKPEGKGPMVRHVPTWKDNISMDLRDT
jgi:hypothetical protein